MRHGYLVNFWHFSRLVNHSNLFYGIIVVFFLFFVRENPASARSRSHSRHAFEFELGVGIATYKSKMVQSNDTSFSSGYKIGINAGLEKNLSVLIQSQSNTTNFEYADVETKSKVESTFQNTFIRYFWGPLYIGFGFDLSTLNVVLNDNEHMKSLSHGMGGTFGVIAPIGKNNMIYLDIASLSPTETMETVQIISSQTASLGSRLDLELGGIINLSKDRFDLKIGYKQRTFAVTIGSETYSELQTMTMIAFTMNQDL